jgi:hypothetical protein
MARCNIRMNVSGSVKVHTNAVRFIEMQENIRLADGQMFDEWKIHEAFR